MTAACAITLPNPSVYAGRRLRIAINYDPAVGGGTIKRFSAEKIDGVAADITLVTGDKFSICFIDTNGTDWVASRGSLL